MNANAEIIAELRRVLNERDEAREQLDLTKRELGRWVDRETKAVRERDEARAACPDCAMWAERSTRWHDDMQRAERERDEWRDKFIALNQTAGELCNACGWAFKIPGEPCRCEVVKERDEARATIAQIRRVFGNALAFDDARGDIVKMAEIAYRGACDGDKAVGELRGMTRQRDEARAEVERLRIALLEVQTSESAPAWFADGFHEGWKAGAEAMREACAQWVDHWVSGHVADKLRDMPVPEEP